MSTYLDKFATDLIKEFKDSASTHPIIGRDSEIRRIITILSKQSKGNVLLVGEGGVGKNAVIQGLLKLINTKEVPFNFPKRIYSIQKAEILSIPASSRRIFHERLLGVF